MEQQDILSIIRQNHYQLLGEIFVSDQERERLKKYVALRLINAVRSGELDTRTPDLKFVLGMTQVVIEGYDGSFWDTLANFAKVRDEQGGIRKIDQMLQKKIGNYVLETLRYAGLFWLPPEKTPFKFAENLKCQAFVPDKYMPDWFDFWYDYYRRNLLYCLDDFTDEDIRGISDFMKNTLQGNDKMIQVKLGRKPRSYQLLIATRRVLAYCSGTAVPELIKITLRMIDDYVHFQKLPDPEQPFYGRFERGFAQWTQLLEQRDPSEQPVRRQVLYSQAPYLFLDARDGSVKLCIPPQRFPASEAKEQVSGVLNIGGRKEPFQLSVYRAFGRYITEEIPPFEIRSLFAPIAVRIDGKLRLRLPALPYRLFLMNEHDRSLTRYIPSDRACCLLCKAGADVHSAQTLEPLELPSYQGYEIASDMTGEIYVDGQPIPRADRNDNKPCHPYILQRYRAEYAGKQLVCCPEHPVICLSMTAAQLAQAVLEVGDRRWDGDMLARFASESEEEPEMRHVELDLSDLITEDGVYSVHLRIPGQPPALLGRYCLLRSFGIRTKPVYCLPGEELTLALGRSEITKVIADSKGVFSCRPPMKGGPCISFDLPVIRWGSTPDELESCPSSVWYQVLDTTLCVQFRGARSLTVCIGDVTTETACLDPQQGLFRADLTEALTMLADSDAITVPVLLRPVLSSHSDVPDIRLFTIIRRTYTVPALVLHRTQEGGVMLEFDALIGENDLYLDIRDAQTGALCAGKLRLQAGQTVLEGLDPAKTYTLHRFMLEKGDVFDPEETRVEYPVIESRCIDPNDPLDTVYRLAEIVSDSGVQEPAAEVRIGFEEQCGEATFRGAISYRRQNDPSFTTLGNTHRFRMTAGEGSERLVQMLPADSDFNCICLMHSTRMLLRRSAPAMRGCTPKDYTCLHDEDVILHLIPDTGKELAT